MALLQTLQGFFVLFDCSFQLLDIFGPALSERGLCLTIALFALFRGCIYLSLQLDLGARPRGYVEYYVRACVHPYASGLGRVLASSSAPPVRERTRRRTLPRKAQSWGPAVYPQGSTCPLRTVRSLIGATVLKRPFTRYFRYGVQDMIWVPIQPRAPRPSSDAPKDSRYCLFVRLKNVQCVIGRPVVPASKV